MAGKGGRTEGAGRKKGSVNKATIAQKKAFDELKLTVLAAQKSLLRVQMGGAKGSYIVMKHTKGKKPERVTSMKEIENFMIHQENGFLNDEDEKTYYLLTVKEPDLKAIDSLLDRVHGRARQNIGVDGGEDDKPIAIKVVEEELKSWADKK